MTTRSSNASKEATDDEPLSAPLRSCEQASSSVKGNVWRAHISSRGLQPIRFHGRSSFMPAGQAQNADRHRRCPAGRGSKSPSLSPARFDYSRTPRGAPAGAPRANHTPRYVTHYESRARDKLGAVMIAPRARSSNLVASLGWRRDRGGCLCTTPVGWLAGRPVLYYTTNTVSTKKASSSADRSPPAFTETRETARSRGRCLKIAQFLIRITTRATKQIVVVSHRVVTNTVTAFMTTLVWTHLVVRGLDARCLPDTGNGDSSNENVKVFLRTRRPPRGRRFNGRT